MLNVRYTNKKEQMKSADFMKQKAFCFIVARDVSKSATQCALSPTSPRYEACGRIRAKINSENPGKKKKPSLFFLPRFFFFFYNRYKSIHFPNRQFLPRVFYVSAPKKKVLKWHICEFTLLHALYTSIGT